MSEYFNIYLGSGHSSSYYFGPTCSSTLETEIEPAQTDDSDVKPMVTSLGQKVPKRNPAAKAWVSPYGGKRK